MAAVVCTPCSLLAFHNPLFPHFSHWTITPFGCAAHDKSLPKLYLRRPNQNDSSTMASSLADFILIGPGTFLYTPPKPTPGQLIILCTWLGAARRHIAKYTALYRCIAPNARILLVESSVGILASAFVRPQRVIGFAPAAAAVLDTLAECEHRSSSHPKRSANGRLSDEMTNSRTCRSTPSSSYAQPKTLMHIFSNGGMNSATHLLRVLRSRMDQPLALTGMMFDSCPGKATSYWQTFDAMVLSFPKTIFWRFLGALAVHCFLIFVSLYIACGYENPATFWRRGVLEESSPARGACYLFSREDRMIEWTDVEQHAEEARRKGWRVKEVLFEGSGHCAHLNMDRRRYVQAVNSVWDGDQGDSEVFPM